LDIYSLIFLVVALVVLWRLRGVLGSRTGKERPPFDPYTRRDRPAADANDNVLTLPRAGGRAPSPTATAGEPDIDTVAPAGSALNEALRTIASADRSFDPEHFITGSKAAYEMIVVAFANGDRDTLKALLSPEVYENFAAELTAREGRGETVETTFVGLERAEPIEASLRGGIAQVTVRFVSQLISATRDKAGAVIDGDPGKVTDVTDVWTFARELKARDPNWKIIATGSDG
jgi:predicted lipid-binding transport protein (Tim44 family)